MLTGQFCTEAPSWCNLDSDHQVGDWLLNAQLSYQRWFVNFLTGMVASAKTASASASRFVQMFDVLSGSLTSLSTTFTSTTTRTPFVSGNDVPNQRLLTHSSAWQGLVVATTTASIFSLLHPQRKYLHLLDKTTTAIRSWVSEMAISCTVQTFGISMALCLDRRPFANSPILHRHHQQQSHLDFWSDVSLLHYGKDVESTLFDGIPFLNLSTSCFNQIQSFEL